MSETVWLLSQWGGVPVGAFAPPLSDWGDNNTAVAVDEMYGSCKPLLPDQFPKRLVETKEVIEHEEDFLEAGLTPPRRKLLPLPPIFRQGLNFTFLNEPTAEITSNFKLGRTELHKLGLFARDGRTPHDGFGYWMNILEVHPCLNAKLSEDLDIAGYTDLPGRGKTERWMPPGRDDAPVLSEPLPDLDLWRDPQLIGSFFVRDALATALKKLKGGKKLRFIRCQVVKE